MTAVTGSALHALHGNEVEADAALALVRQFVKRRVGGRLAGGAADAQHVFARVLRIELELFDRPRLDLADTRPRRKLVIDGAFEEIYRHCDLAAAAQVQAAAALDALDLLLAVVEFVPVFVLINEEN